MVCISHDRVARILHVNSNTWSPVAAIGLPVNEGSTIGTTAAPPLGPHPAGMTAPPPAGMMVPGAGAYRIAAGNWKTAVGTTKALRQEGEVAGAGM